MKIEQWSFILTGNHIYMFHIKCKIVFTVFYAIDIFVLQFLGVSSQIEIKQWIFLYLLEVISFFLLFFFKI